MQERRNYPRLPLNQEAKLFLENRINPIICVVEDISPLGVRITLRKRLFPEAFAKFNLVLSETLSLDIGASVIWEDSFEGGSTYGLSFNQIEEKGKEKLVRLVEEGFLERLKEKWWNGL